MSAFESAGYKTSLTREDFPLPDTPVMQLNTPSGILTSTFLRLFCLAPLISINLPFDERLAMGTGIESSPLRYLPVMLSLLFITSSTLPHATTFPPCTPAPGPMSTM